MSPRRALARLAAAAALAAASSGCSSGVAIEVDVEPGCVAGATSYDIVVTASAMQRRATLTADDFAARHMRVAVIPPDGATTVDVAVVARDAGGAVVAHGETPIGIAGAGMVRQHLDLIGGVACGEADAAVDGAIADAAGADGASADGPPRDGASLDLSVNDAHPQDGPVDGPTRSDGPGGPDGGPIGSDGGVVDGLMGGTGDAIVGGGSGDGGVTPTPIWHMLASGTRNDLHGVWASATSPDVWVVGRNMDPSTEILHTTSGTSFVAEPTFNSNQLWSVSAIDPSTVFAVGDNGAVGLRGVNGWVAQTIAGLSLTSPLLSVSAVTGGSVAYATGPGQLARWDMSGGWRMLTSSSSPGLVTGNYQAVSAYNGQNVWLVGESGLVEHWNGAIWTQIVGVPTTVTLFAVDASTSTLAYVVGSGGYSARVDLNTTPATVVPLSSGTAQDLLGVSAGSLGGAYAVGRGETALHIGAGQSSWSPLPSPPAASCTYANVSRPCDLHHVAAPAKADIWVVGDGGLLLHYF